MSRAYTPDDLAAIQRIWKECGWVDSDDEAAYIESFLSEASVYVGEVDGGVECSASGHTGRVRYTDTDLDALLVTAVTTSWVGRKQGLARRLTADVLAEGASNGAVIAALGIFEHGFYNTLGFGSGPYEHVVRFDPSALQVDVPYRTPIRLTEDDYADVAAALQRRRRSHGGVAIDGAEFMKAEMGWLKPPLGLGYRDADGRLTHFVIGRAKGEQGPYRLNVVSYETTDQLLELMAMIRSLGDQVRSVAMAEPPELQLQSLIRYPFRAQAITKGNDFEAGIKADAWWQIRILDVAACVAARSWHGPVVRFNLGLTDPLTEMFDDGWKGVAGEYTVEIGPTSQATSGTHSDLPTLVGGVGAFTRMWLGSSSASSLAVTGDLVGPSDLIARLDEAFRLPTPRPGIYF